MTLIENLTIKILLIVNNFQWLSVWLNVHFRSRSIKQVNCTLGVELSSTARSRASYTRKQHKNDIEQATKY